VLAAIADELNLAWPHRSASAVCQPSRGTNEYLRGDDVDCCHCGRRDQQQSKAMLFNQPWHLLKALPRVLARQDELFKQISDSILLAVAFSCKDLLQRAPETCNATLLAFIISSLVLRAGQIKHVRGRCALLGQDILRTAGSMGKAKQILAKAGFSVSRSF
jgi:hypothetical protein